MKNENMDVPRGYNYDIDEDVNMEYLMDNALEDKSVSLFDRIPDFEAPKRRVVIRRHDGRIQDYQYRMIRNPETDNLMFLRTPDAGNTWEQCGKWTLQEKDVKLANGETIKVESVVPTSFKRVPDGSDFYAELRGKELTGELMRYGQGDSYPSPIDMPRDDLKKLFQIARRVSKKVVNGEDVIKTYRITDKRIDEILDKLYLDKEVRDAIQNERDLERQIYESLMESNYVIPGIYSRDYTKKGEAVNGRTVVDPNDIPLMNDPNVIHALPDKHKIESKVSNSIPKDTDADPDKGRIKIFRRDGERLDLNNNPLPAHIHSINKLNDKEEFKVGDIEFTIADSYIKNFKIPQDMKEKLEAHMGPGSWKSVLKDLPNGEILCSEADELREELKNAFVQFASTRYNLLEKTSLNDMEAQKEAARGLPLNLSKAMSHHKVFSGMLNGSYEQRVVAAGVLMEAWTEAGAEFRNEIDDKIKKLTPKALRKIADAKKQQSLINAEEACKDAYKFIQDDRMTLGLILLAPYAPIMAVIALLPFAFHFSSMASNKYASVVNADKADHDYNMISERVDIMKSQLLGKYCVYDFITRTLEGKDTASSSYFEDLEKILKGIGTTFDTNIGDFMKKEYETKLTKNSEMMKTVKEQLNKFLEERECKDENGDPSFGEDENQKPLSLEDLFGKGEKVLNRIKEQSKVEEYFNFSMVTNINSNKPTSPEESSDKPTLLEEVSPEEEWGNIKPTAIELNDSDKIAGVKATEQIIEYKKNLHDVKENTKSDFKPEMSSFEKAKVFIKNENVLCRYRCNEIGGNVPKEEGVASGLTGLVASMYVKKHVAEKAFDMLNKNERQAYTDITDEAKGSIKRYMFSDDNIAGLAEADMRMRCMAASKPHEFNKHDAKELMEKICYVKYMHELTKNGCNVQMLEEPVIVKNMSLYEKILTGVKLEVYNNIKNENILNSYSVKFKIGHTIDEISNILGKCKGLSYAEFLNASADFKNSENNYVSLLSEYALKERFGSQEDVDSLSKEKLSSTVSDILYSLSMYDSYESQVNAYCTNANTVSDDILSSFAIEASEDVRKSYKKINDMGPLYVTAACDVISKMGMNEQFRHCMGAEADKLYDINKKSVKRTEAMAERIIKRPDFMQSLLSANGSSTMAKESFSLLMAGIETLMGATVISLAKDNLMNRDTRNKIDNEEIVVPEEDFYID